MLTLYVRPTCPYCQKVLKRSEELGITFDQKDITVPENAAALMEKGGKQQVPFLVDADRGVSLYESGDIIGYLEEQYPKLTS